MKNDYTTLQAPTFKLIGNSLVLGSLELIAEAYTIAEKSGIGQELVYEYIKGEVLKQEHFRPLKSNLS
jgi:3-hydroxyisobutyrate dehydrogenase-like beta-hydroxyacid dehydrogenase